VEPTPSISTGRCISGSNTEKRVWIGVQERGIDAMTAEPCRTTITIGDAMSKDVPLAVVSCSLALAKMSLSEAKNRAEKPFIKSRKSQEYPQK